MSRRIKIAALLLTLVMILTAAGCAGKPAGPEKTDTAVIVPTQAPETENKATEQPGTEAPGTDIPATEANETELPATELPATDAGNAYGDAFRNARASEAYGYAD